jgi:arylsulfatase A-like enzyme
MKCKSLTALSLSLCFGLQAAQDSDQEQKQRNQRRPNILFIIMDDVGIDQLRSFGYGGLIPPNTPVLDVVARNGIRFRNMWAMPECSPSRAVFFEGRYPLRTNIYSAILSTDLANSQVSPYEVTTPKILRHADYTSALFGKFHLAGPDNNPFGSGTPNSLGFDYFHGFLEGAPHPIDTTAGGVVTNPDINPNFPQGPFSCGFVPNTNTDSVNGADTGACYFAGQGGCQVMTQTPTVSTPGRNCMEKGGIFVPNQSCQSAPPSTVNFSLLNGYYVWPLVENDRKTGTVKTYDPPYTDPRQRTYSPIEETTAAIDWIKKQSGDTPWMTTVAYSSIHSPYQQAPQRLTPGSPDLSGVPCDGSKITNTHTLSDQMLEAMDTEIGRLLVGAGLATRDQNGAVHYDPSQSNTMLVIIGDNGTYGPGVKAPFDPTHAKAYVNQTGVWVPLIVAGPLVNSPDRNVESMVNVADLFQLFGEMADLDVRKYVPAARKLDSVSMLPYLTNPGQQSLRQFNFTQTASNISATPPPGPCVINSNVCIQLFPNKPLCEDEQGTWYGQGGEHGEFASCCALQASNTVPNLEIFPVAQAAVRNDKFKLIQLTNQSCQSGQNNGTTTQYQLYRINESAPIPLIDFPALNLIRPNLPNNGLTRHQQAVYAELKQQLNETLDSSPQCPGDGNSDGLVNQTDIRNWNFYFTKKSGQSSWYDFPTLDSNGIEVYDGTTDRQDLQVIQNNFGKRCQPR